MDTIPRRRSLVYTEQINVKVEPQLRAVFDEIKRTTSIDISEAQRMALRELAEKLKRELKGAAG